MATKTKKGMQPFSITLPDKLVLSYRILDKDLADHWVDLYGIKIGDVGRNAVKCLVDDMQRGHWKDIWASDDPLVFTDPKKAGKNSPALLNGRKRILAVSMSGVSIPVFILEGMSKNAMPEPSGWPDNLAHILKQEGAYSDSCMASALAYTATRVELNDYTLRASLKRSSRTHASREDAHGMANTRIARFSDFCAKASKMCKSTLDRGAFAYARFCYVADQFGTNTHKSDLAQFCATFATDPDTHQATKLAADTIRNRIARLHRYEPLDTAWVIGVMLKALDAYVNGQKLTNPGNVEATLDAWEGRIAAIRVSAPRP